MDQIPFVLSWGSLTTTPWQCCRARGMVGVFGGMIATMVGLSKVRVLVPPAPLLSHFVKVGVLGMKLRMEDVRHLCMKKHHH